jgi:hypothetical protein
MYCSPYAPINPMWTPAENKSRPMAPSASVTIEDATITLAIVRSRAASDAKSAVTTASFPAFSTPSCSSRY